MGKFCSSDLQGWECRRPFHPESQRSAGTWILETDLFSRGAVGRARRRRAECWSWDANFRPRNYGNQCPGPCPCTGNTYGWSRWWWCDLQKEHSRGSKHIVAVVKPVPRFKPAMVALQFGTTGAELWEFWVSLDINSWIPVCTLSTDMNPIVVIVQLQELQQVCVFFQSVPNKKVGLEHKDTFCFQALFYCYSLSTMFSKLIEKVLISAKGKRADLEWDIRCTTGWTCTQFRWCRQRLGLGFPGRLLSVRRSNTRFAWVGCLEELAPATPWNTWTFLWCCVPKKRESYPIPFEENTCIGLE